MSEKIYALLFRLYPARFRAAWREDALELFRDRYRSERGLLPRLRLWLDLFADTAASLPRVYLREQEALPVPANPDGVPAFQMLEGYSIRPSVFTMGTILTVLALAGVSVLLDHGGHIPITRAGSSVQARGVTVDPWNTRPDATGSGDGDTEAIGPGTVQPATAKTRPGSAVMVHTAAPPMPLFDSAERHRVVMGVVAAINRHYPHPDLAPAIDKVLIAHDKSGDYDHINDPTAFAAALTQQIRAASRDMHFEVIFSQRVLYEHPAPSFNNEEYRAVMQQANCTFDKVQILPHNVGYLKLNSFPDPEVCGSTAIAAMKTLSRADALIIDLRDNSGGSPEMVLFLGGWLFDRPAFFWTPRYDSAAQMLTHSPMAGSGLANKPVWVLTSPRTWSGAEHFSYNMKMLHRATLVGETTGGATDVGVFHCVDDHFGIGILETKVPNPYPTPDWAVTGVQPDIEVPSSGALDTAQKLAAKKLTR